MALSDKELQQLEEEFRAELEREHHYREERAKQKAARRKQKRRQGRSASLEIDQMKAQMRMRFYQEKGYEEALDPTGRKMYLSPSEIKMRTGREEDAKNRKAQANSAKIFEKQFGVWPIYLAATFIAVVLALMLVKSV